MVVGCIVQHEDQILLCKRAIEPRHGFWTIPGGFLELGEGTREGALRETKEEAEAEVSIIRPHCHIDIPHIGQAYVLFCASFSENQPQFGAGEETLESALVSVSDIPWQQLAFPVVAVALKLYAEDHTMGRKRYHHGVLEAPAPAPNNPSFGRPALICHQAIDLQ